MDVWGAAQRGAGFPCCQVSRFTPLPKALPQDCHARAGRHRKMNTCIQSGSGATRTLFRGPLIAACTHHPRLLVSLGATWSGILFRQGPSHGYPCKEETPRPGARGVSSRRFSLGPVLPAFGLIWLRADLPGRDLEIPEHGEVMPREGTHKLVRAGRRSGKGDVSRLTCN